jgi:hypothetical protein
MAQKEAGLGGDQRVVNHLFPSLVVMSAAESTIRWAVLSGE